MKDVCKIGVGVCALLLMAMMCLVAGAGAEEMMSEDITYLSADIISQFGIPIDGWYSTDDSAAQFALLVMRECDPYYSEEMVYTTAEALEHETIYLGITDGRLTLFVFGEAYFWMFMYEDDGEAGIVTIPYQNAYQVSEETMDFLVEKNGIEAYRQINMEKMMELIVSFLGEE